MTRALSACKSFMALGGGVFISACTVIGPDYEAPSPDAFASEGFVYDAGYSTDEPLASGGRRSTIRRLTASWRSALKRTAP